MKKTLSIVLSMAMLSSLFAFSANAVAPAADISKMSVKQVAYMDLNSASPATKEAILAARDEIIHGDQAWTVDGTVTLIDLNNGTEEKIPEFSELFPGWDVPTVEVDPGQAALEEYFLTNGVPKASYYKEPYNIFLNLGSSFAASPRFATVFGTGDPVACYGYAGPVNGRFNLGFSTGGKELGWVPNRSVEQQQGAKIATTNGLVYDVRASASNPESADWYTLVVADDPKVMAGLLVSSANAVTPVTDISNMSVEQVAYLDLNSASPAVKEAILAARNEIIYGDKAWTVGGAVTFIDLKNGTEERIPEFSELFPGWDVPVAKIDTTLHEGLVYSPGIASNNYLDNYYDIPLALANSFAASPSFAAVAGSGDPLTCYGYAGPKNGRFNLEFSTGAIELGWVPNLSAGEHQGAKLNTKVRTIYDICASAAGLESANWYTIHVTDDPEITKNFPTKG